jgi:EAL domain-containing protein (putative c-di-GMP-specific phosphodiesterase class I)
MAAKKNIIACTKANKLISLISSLCKSCGLDVLFINNGRELPAVLDSSPIAFILIDTTIEDPCVIDLLNLLAGVQCDIPVLIVGDCEEKILFSINRIGTAKGLTVHVIPLNYFEDKTFKEILDVFDKKRVLINAEAITTGLEKKQFLMFYQPKIAIRNKLLAGVEALIRWERPLHGLTSPDSFIPIAEESGLIIPMTYWVIKEVFSQYAAWRKINVNVNIAINLSPQILTDLILPDELNKLSEEYKVNPKHICFEITEAAAMHWPDVVLEVLTRLRLKGFSLSIDDFGTGYSSLVELQRLPFTELKIDKSFVTDLTDNKANMHIVRSIINLGQNMGLSLVAEGVETQDAMDNLTNLGCDNVQGYLISKPLSASDFINWYRIKVNKDGIYLE